MRLKFISPFKTSFNILFFNAMRDHYSYLSFWDKVQKYYKDDQTITFKHVSEHELIYETINEDGNYFSPEIMTIKQDPIFSKIIEDAKDHFSTFINQYHIVLDDHVSHTVCRLYDDAVGLIETIITVDAPLNLLDKDKMQVFFEDIQEFGNHYMKFITKEYYLKRIEKLIEQISKLDDNNYVQKVYSKKQIFNKIHKKARFDFLESERFATPLWVNRTLFLNDVENRHFFYHHWLSIGDEDLSKLDETLTKDRFYFGWGNNLVLTGYEEKSLNSVIDALNLCQYYYVVLEQMNSQLSKLVGEVYSTNGNGSKVKKLEKLLEVHTENVNLMFMQLTEQSLNLQGHRKKYFEELLYKWKVESIQKSINTKISISRERLDYFYRKSTKLSNTISESILFAIGGIALVDFFANLSLYARSLRTNPGMVTPEEIPSIGFISLGNLFSPDHMIWTGILIFLFLFFVFVNVKRRS